MWVQLPPITLKEFSYDNTCGSSSERCRQRQVLDSTFQCCLVLGIECSDVVHGIIVRHEVLQGTVLFSIVVHVRIDDDIVDRLHQAPLAHA